MSLKNTEKDTNQGGVSLVSLPTNESGSKSKNKSPVSMHMCLEMKIIFSAHL